MPSTKQQYLRYARLSSFGVVNSRRANALLLEAARGRARWPQIIAPANEDVIIWDPRTGERVGSILLSDSYYQYFIVSSFRMGIRMLKVVLLANPIVNGAHTRIPLHMLPIIIYTHPQVAVLRGDKHEVSSLALSPDRTTLAAGYEDGCVRLWSVASCDSHITFR